MKTPPLFAKETDLCAAFMALVEKQGAWVPYPETCGWDILLVHKAEGVQIGVEAKLKLNTKVLTQAVESRWGTDEGPDFRAILVPHGKDNDVGTLADLLGITVISVRKDLSIRQGTIGFFQPDLPSANLDGRYDEWWPRLPLKRHVLPEFVPDVVAGASGPVMLTRWKIQAIKLAVLLEQTGYLTRQDFKDKAVDHRRWTDKWTGWLRPTDKGVYERGPQMPDFKAQHPLIWEEILAQPEKWERPPAAAKPKPRQGRFL